MSRIRINPRSCFFFFLPALLSCSVTGDLFSPDVGSAATAVMPTAEPSSTETAILAPTATLRPSFTPTPPCVPPTGSRAMRDAQEEMDALISGSTAIWFDDFLCSDIGYGWGVGYENVNTRVTVADGVLTFRTQEVKDVWDGVGRTEWNIQDRTGILLLFRAQGGTSANFFIHTGTWQTSDFRRWGFEIRLVEQRKALWSGFEGTSWIDGGSPEMGVKPDAWYYLFIRLGEAGQVTMKIWEKDNPARHADFLQAMGSGWTGRRWWSLFQVYDGTIQIDKYWEAAFVG
jgi:hypothetical protein